MGDIDRLIRFHIPDRTFRQIDIHVHTSIVHDTDYRFPLFDTDIRRIMGQIHDHTVERSFDIHLLQIELTVLVIIAGVCHFYLRITHFTKRHTAFLIQGFLLHLLLLGYFKTQLFGIDSDTVFVFPVFEADDQLSFGDDISQFKGLACTGIGLQFVQATHFGIERYSIGRLCRTGRIDQLADRTFLQFRYRHGCSNIVLCILWLIITTCRQQDKQ